MTISVKHAFQSAKGDSADTTLVNPSDWNDEHVITMAANTLLGRTTGAGAAEEVPCTSLARQILAASDAATILTALGIGGFSTGDVKFTLKSTADTGWIMMDDGTIGDASSAATTRANADCEDLFTLIWEGVSDTYAPVTGGRGVSAAADWAAHKKIALTKVLGRALAAAGSGSGLSARTLGQTAGEETHALTTAELATHNHTLTDPGHTHVGPAIQLGSTPSGTNPYPFIGSVNNSTNYNMIENSATTGITLADAGSGTAHNNVQPTTFLNCMVKL